MPRQVRHKTKYQGVFFINGTSVTGKGTEKIFYIHYRKSNKLIEEKAGKQYQENMTAAKASRIRAQRIEGNEPSNQEKRIHKRESEQARRWTLDFLWDDYKAGKPLTKSLKSDDYLFQKYIKPRFGSKLPDEIEPVEVDKLRAALLKTKSPQTAKYVLCLIRRTVNFGVKRQQCQKLVFTIEMPKVHNLKTEDLTPNELERLLKAIEEDPHIIAANMMRLVLFTGMRRGELFQLKWDDLDYERNFIHIRNPKGGVDQKIPMNDSAKDLLLHHPHSDSPFVFPGRGGNQRSDIKHQVNRIKERAGLPKDFRALHGLRHFYASMLASSGEVDLYTLQKLLTHKSPQMTQRYAHLRDDALRKASNVADSILNDALSKTSK